MSYRCVICIPKFDQFNSKAAGKKVSWFRVDVSLVHSMEYASMTSGAKLLWFYSLAQACSSTRREVLLDSLRMAQHLHLNASRVRGAIEELLQLGWFQLVTENDRKASTLCTNERTNDKNERTTCEVDAYASHSPIKILETKSKKIRRNPNINRPVWTAYESAYFERYKVPVTRNMRVNSQMSQFIDRVGQSDAANILEFYLRHNDALYLKSMHSIGLALRDAEALRTQWLKGRTMTMKDARDGEKQNSYVQQYEKIQKGEI